MRTLVAVAALSLLAGPAAAHEFIIYYGPGEVEPPTRYWSTIVGAAGYGSAPGSKPVCVIAHTDSVGAPSSNLALSRRRAEAVARMLIKLGVRPESIGLDMRGELFPAVPAGDEAAEPLNRRAVIANGACRAL